MGIYHPLSLCGLIPGGGVSAWRPATPPQAGCTVVRVGLRCVGSWVYMLCSYLTLAWTQCLLTPDPLCACLWLRHPTLKAHPVTHANHTHIQRAVLLKYCCTAEVNVLWLYAFFSPMLICSFFFKSF